MATLAPRFEDTIASEDSRFRGPLFVLTILVGSFLLFLVQPMIARMALPRLGGAPAVWNSAMLVYQALLLGGYAYAHAIGRLAPLRQAAIHLVLLAVAAFWLPIGLDGATPSPTAAPELWVPWLLTLSIGPLFFMVAAQAPLMQRWYSDASGGRDPYALYAASNLGSFAGLVAYPLLVEPTLPLAEQSGVWTWGYVLLFVLVIGCATMLPRRGAAAAAVATESEPPTLLRKLYWVALALVPSGLMLSTTTHLTTDIVAMPLLWVLPLGLYLLSFTVAFATRRYVADVLTFVAPYAVLILGGLTVRPIGNAPFFQALCGLALLFIVAIVLHGEMYRTRPMPDRLTGFYLAMSIGGVLGGVFAALLAPVVFDWTYEHPLLILAAGALIPQLFLFPSMARIWRNRTRAQILTAVVLFLTIVISMLAIRRPWEWLWYDGQEYGAVAIGLITMLCIGRRVPYLIGLAGVLIVYGGWSAIELSMQGDARTRSYFGVYTIRDHPELGMRTLAHGTTTHGSQIMDPARLAEPTSYYAPLSGVGQAMIMIPAIAGEHARIGVVGLGTGTLACYAKPGQDWRFFEIDPAVIGIARDSGKFAYLASCLPNPRIILGDARLTLSQQPEASLDLLALDAFSSDAVPLHLLTKEAFETYGRVLGKSGLLLVHISNRFLDLEPVVAEAARDGRWTAALLADEVTEGDPNGQYRSNSVWIAMSHDPSAIGKLINVDGPVSGAWRPLMPREGFEGWSDDFASIIPLIRALEPEPGQ